jgi:hypothetical protein
VHVGVAQPHLPHVATANYLEDDMYIQNKHRHVRDVIVVLVPGTLSSRAMTTMSVWGRGLLGSSRSFKGMSPAYV